MCFRNARYEAELGCKLNVVIRVDFTEKMKVKEKVYGGKKETMSFRKSILGKGNSLCREFMNGLCKFVQRTSMRLRCLGWSENWEEQ